MKRILFCGLACALLASAVAAGERSTVRSSVAQSALGQPVQLQLGQPVELGQTTEIQLPAPLPAPSGPALTPVPDPLYTPTLQQRTPAVGPLVPQQLDRYTTQYQGGVPAASVVNPAPVYQVIGQPMPAAPLFADVRFRAVRNIAPGAVPTIIQVADPCSKNACGKNCVCIEVCAPPCDPRNVKVTRDGDRVRYDYGKYAVVARTVGNHVVVHYYD